MSTSTGTHTDGDLPYKSEATTAADIPAETDDLVVVPALSSQLEEPIGTIVVKSVFDTTFPPRLKGVVDSDSFLTTIEVINWFLELRLYAETEKHSKTFELSQTWRRLYAKYSVDRKRQEIIRQYCVDNRLMCPFYRDYTFTQEEFEIVERKLLEALHLFIDDENRTFIPKGWYWTYPENHGWLWMEFRRVSSSQQQQVSSSPTSSALGLMLKQRLASTLPNVPQPPAPEWDLDMKMTILTSLKVDNHTEYLVYIETNMGKWTPSSIVYALKRYNDFDAFYQQILAYSRIHSFDPALPPFPDKDIIQSKSSVTKRIDMFQAILNHVASHPDLVSSPPVFKFFNVHPCPVAWRGLPYVKRTFLGIYN